MLDAKTLLWLFGAFLYKSANSLPLLVTQKISSDPTSYELIMPDTLISREGASGEHEITLFSPPNLKILFQIYRVRFVAFRWVAANDQPTIHIMPAEGATALRVSCHFDDPKDFSSTRIGPLSLFIKRGDIKSQREAVYFDFTHVHSSFPEWAYDHLNKAFSEKVESTQSIDCDQIPLWNLPTFTFHYGEKILFKLSGPNYFVRSSSNNKVCDFAVQLNKDKNWVIGAAY